MRRTVRLRLTAIYGVLFLACGAGLLAVTYVLVEHSTKVYTYTSKDGRVTGVVSGDGKPSPGGSALTRIERSGNGRPAPAEIDPDKLAALAKKQHTDTMHKLLLDSGIALAVMAVLSAGLGWLVAGRVLRPLRTISSAVRDISATNLHRRLAMTGPRDELSELGHTFDGLLARLDTAFQAQRQFVANASHELRTPLARQRAIGQVALADPEPTVASLRTAHERVLAAGAQQERIILALLALARGQAGLVRREPVDLAELAERVVAGREPEAELRGVLLDTMFRPAVVIGDPRLLESLVANLVDNAVRHNHDGGCVVVSIETVEHRAVLSVRNAGPVVPQDQVAQLLQPFHRLAGERGVHGDGLGVGLSIVQAVCGAHDAELDIAAPDSGGFDVQVRFAATAIGNADEAVGTSTGDRRTSFVERAS